MNGRAELLRLTLPDTRAEDMAALVATAARSGLRDRIAAFRRLKGGAKLD